MADIKISELGAASAVNSTDIFPMTSAGVTVKATAQKIKDYMKIGNLAELSTDAKANLVAAINEVDGHADTAQSTADAAQQMIAPIQSNLTASKAYAVDEQFVYNGLLYKATAAIAQGGTIIINGNCALADSVTGQIKSLGNKLSGVWEIGIATLTGWVPIPQFTNGNAIVDLLIENVPGLTNFAEVLGANGYANNAPWAYVITGCVRTGTSLRVFFMTNTANQTTTDTFSMNIYFIKHVN